MVTAMSVEPNPVMFTYWDVIYHRELPVTVSWNTSNPRVQALLLYRGICDS